MPTRRHVAPLRRSAWLHLAALWLAWGTLAAQAPNRSESDSLDSLLRTAEAHHFRGALGEAHAALAAADSMAKRRSEPAALARVWVTWAGVWISQTTATNAGYLEAHRRRHGSGSRALDQLRRADSLTASIGYVSGVQRARAEQSRLTGADAGR